jgi:tetratricopeptide (TPR) repeat protein
MKQVLILISILLLISGCNNSSLKQQLIEIDSITFQDGDTKALELLDKIKPEIIDDEECLAYYWLLKMRTEIRLQKEINSIDPLEITIKFYKNKDKGKLARAYGYKSHILEGKGDLKGASTALKEAELLVRNDKKEAPLANMIYLSLARINYEAKEFNLALDYGAKSLRYAYLLDNHTNIAFSLLNILMCYHSIGNQDSTSYYIKRCIPLIHNLPESLRPNFYVNIGNILIDTDIKQAEDYLNKSVTTNPNAFAYRGLARIYYKKGEREKALEMWQKALQTDNLYLKTEILQALYNSQQEEGDYKEASQTAMQIAELKDSIAQKEKDEDIRGLQEQFEQEQKRKAERHLYYVTVSAISVFLLIAITAAAYLLYNNTKGKKKLAETIQHLEGYRNRLKVMEQEGKTDSKEVERLNQKIAELQAKQGALLQNGRERYEEIEQGGTTLRWSRNDFTDCIEFYRTVDAAFVTHMEQDYRHLSSKYIFFALMEHLGKTDEELQHIMAISQNTIRSYRSRINNALIITT